MAFFTLRLPDALAERFDAAAAFTGGRSATLRALIDAAVAGTRPLPPVSARPDRAGDRRRIELRLTAADLESIDRHAAERGIKRADWIAALVRARLDGPVPPPADVASALVDAWRQLKRIGINLNQAVHAVNSAAMEGSRLDLAREASRIETFRSDVAAELAKIRGTLNGDRSYWDAEG